MKYSLEDFNYGDVSLVLGNGEILVAENALDITGVRGCPYASDTYLSLTMQIPHYHIECESERSENGEYIRHKLFSTSSFDDENSTADTVFTDYTDPKLPVFVRNFKTFSELKFSVRFPPNVKCYFFERYVIKGETLSCLCFSISEYTSKFYVGEERRALLFLFGDADFVKNEDSGNFDIRLRQGRGNIIIAVGSPESAFKAARYAFENCDNTNFFLNTPSNNIFSSLDVSASRQHFNLNKLLSRIDRIHPEYSNICSLLKNNFCHLTAMQSNDGSIISDFANPVSKTADNYSALRAFLSLGCNDRAEKIVIYWKSLFDKLQDIPSSTENGRPRINANDSAGSAALVILGIFGYCEAAGDKELLISLFPMLKKLFEKQTVLLGASQMPFNGCEQAISGNLFPKESVFHGSAENTLLYIVSGERLRQFTEKNALLPEKKLSAIFAQLDTVKNRFRESFISNGVLYASSSAREGAVKRPRFKPGNCEICDKYSGIDTPLWLEKTPDGLYACPACFEKAMRIGAGRLNRIQEFSPGAKYLLCSTAAKSVYFGRELFADNELADFLAPFIDGFNANGILSSDNSSTRTFISDTAYTLCALTALGSRFADAVLMKLIAFSRRGTLFAEYYNESIPCGSRGRSLEAALVCEAVSRYIAEKFPVV